MATKIDQGDHKGNFLVIKNYKSQEILTKVNESQRISPYTTKKGGILMTLAAFFSMVILTLRSSFMVIQLKLLAICLIRQGYLQWRS